MAERKVQKRTIESREKLNAAAWKLFCEKGYYNTNTKDIAKLAGISVGNFYNYYKDKSDIYYELASQYVTSSSDAITNLEDILVKSENMREAIKEYITNQMDRALATGRFFRDCQVLIQDNERLNGLFRDNTIKVIDRIEILLQHVPNVKKRASDKVMARILFTVVDNLSQDACKIDEPELLEEYRQQMTEIVQNYILGEQE